MQQTTNDDDQPRSAQVLYRSVEEKFEAVQDEVSLLKAEIQQTLIDLREFMMKGHSISSPSVFEDQQPFAPTGVSASPGEQNSPSPKVSRGAPPDPAPAQPYSEPAPQNGPSDARGRYAMDAVKMGHIIAWLGTVTGRGLSPKHLKPFLQSYEQSGHLTSTMAQLTYKSLEDLDGAQGGNPNQSFSSSEYAECLLELHEIICNPGYEPNEPPVAKGRRKASPTQRPVDQAQEADNG